MFEYLKVVDVLWKWKTQLIVVDGSEVSNVNSTNHLGHKVSTNDRLPWTLMLCVTFGFWAQSLIY